LSWSALQPNHLVPLLPRDGQCGQARRQGWIGLRGRNVWLGKSGAATMLSQLARNGEPISHATLDSLSSTRHANDTREILLRTTISEPRNEYLERLGLWVDHYLAGVPNHQASFLSAYAQW